MENTGLQPTGETSLSRFDEEPLLPDDNINLDETNEDLTVKPNSFLQQLNKSLHSMIGSIMAKSLKRLHEVDDATEQRKHLQQSDRNLTGQQ